MKRQGQVVAGLFAQGPERLEEALKIAQTSTGSAMREHERSMDSIAFKSQTLANNVTKFWQSAVNSESIKMFIDSLTFLVIGLTKLSNSIGLLPLILGLTTAAFLLFNNAVKASAANLLVMLRHTILVRLGLAPTIVTTNTLTAAFWNLNLSLVGITTALRGLMVTAGVFLLPVAAIMGVAYGITKLTTSIMKNREETKNLEEYNKNLVRSWSLHKKETEDLINTYNNLSSIDKSVGLSVEQEQEYLDVQNKLGELLPNLVDHIDEKGQAHLKNSEAIKEELVYLDKLINLEKQRQVAAFRDEVSSADKDIQKKQREIAQRERAGYMQGSEKYVKNEMAILKLEKEIAELTDDIEKNLLNVIKIDLELDDVKLDPILSKSLDEVVEKLDVTKDNAESLKHTLVELFTGLSLSPNFINTQEFIDLLDQLEITDVDKVINFALNIEGIQISDKIKQQIKNLTDNLDIGEENVDKLKHSLLSLFKLISDNPDFINTDKFKQALEGLSDLGLDSAQIDLIKTSFNNLSKEVKDANKELTSFQKTLKDAQENMSTSIGKIQNVKEALDEYNDSGKFNLSTIVELAKEYPQLLEYLGDEAALRRELENVIQEQQEAFKNAHVNMLMFSASFYNERVRHNKEFQEIMSKYNIDNLDQFKNLAQAKLEVETKLLQQLANIWSGYYNAATKSATHQFTILEAYVKSGATTSPTLIAEYNQVKSIIDQLNQAEKAFDDIALKNINVDFSKIGLDKGKDKKSDNFSKTFELWKIKLDEINQLITVLNDKLEDAISHDEKLKIYDQIIQAQKNKLEILKEIRKFQESELELVKNQLKKSLSTKDYQNLLQGDYSNLEITNKNNKNLAELIDKYLNLSSAIKSTTNEINGMDNAIRDIVSNINNIYVEKLKDAFSAITDNLKNQLNTENIYDVDKLLDDINALETGINSIGDYNLSDALSVDKVSSDISDIGNKILDLNSKIANLNNTNIKDRNILLSTIEEEISLNNELKSTLKNIDNEIRDRTLLYKRQEEALKKQIDSVKDSYDRQVEVLQEKLKLLDEEIEKEDRLKRLNEINEELAKTLKDKRFSYITAEGEEILTYDKAKVSELEKNKDEMLRQFEREDLKQSIRDEIERLQKSRDDKVAIMEKELEDLRFTNQQKLDSLILYRDNVASLQTILENNINIHIQNLEGLHNLEIENIGKSNAEKQNLRDADLRSLKKYVDEVVAEYKRMAAAMAMGGGSGGGGGGGSSGSVVVWDSAKDGLPWEKGVKADDLIKKYHKGGIVSERPDNKLTKLVNKLFNTAPNEQIVAMLKGELAIPPQNIAQNFIPNMKNLISSIIPRNNVTPIVNSKHFNFKDITIKANNITEFLDSLNFLVKTEG